MYLAILNGEITGEAFTFHGARLLIGEEAWQRGMDALCELLQFTSDADAMRDYQEWRDDNGNVAIVEYVEV